jgi:putative phage-type endonuclease
MMDDSERAAWLEERAGKLTASRMADAMDFLKSGKPSKARTDYMKELLAERLADATARHYVSPAMLHGIEYEDEAKRAYETATADLIDDPRNHAPLGFFNHPRIPNFGASPDGMLGRWGLIEVKCPTTAKFVDWRLSGAVPDEHQPQMLAQLACTGRRFVMFCAYDPRIRDPDGRLFVRRYEPKQEEIAAVEAAAEQFVSELEALWERLTENTACPQ